jgi:hypothetical protein
VLLILTLHTSNKIDPDSGGRCRSEVIKFHDYTNSVVETVEKVCAGNTGERKTCYGLWSCFVP